MLNRTVLTGRMVETPELRQTENGVPVTSFRIAVGRDFVSEGDVDVDFFDITAWRKTAEFICRHFEKGKMISIDGRLKNRTWKDKQRQNRVTTEIIIDNAYFGEKKDKSNDDRDSGTTTEPNENMPPVTVVIENTDSGFNPFDN